MAKRENCEHRHTNGNCLFNGGFCLANDEEHCVRINEIKSYNQALEDFLKEICIGCAYLNVLECNNPYKCPCSISQAEVVREVVKLKK